MKISTEQQGFKSQHDEHPLPLRGMQVTAVLQDLLAEVTITQIFTNDENQPIEAVYTFPLPIDAVLLSFAVTLGERQLWGILQERQQAENNYGVAIQEGNTAILLQQLEAGLYTVNVGNLLEHETAIITFSYAQLHQWSSDELRWYLPTVIAPRYGKPDMQSQQTPESNLAVEYLYTLSVSVQGLLRTAFIQSPTHAIETEISNTETRIYLKEGRAFLDRDLILTLQLAANKVCAITDRDFDGYVALASFYPKMESSKPHNKQPRSIKLLVDCSGSMAGDSIAQARIALMNIVDSLDAQDTFVIIRFGDGVVGEIAKPLTATKANILKARNIIAKIEADLGGTEIFRALEQTINLKSEQQSADILLITDGEVWDESSENSQTQKIIQLANKSQQRIFTVGVGSAVSERLVRELAEGTNGACELVTPGEGMASKIERHFKRIYAEQALSIEVNWSSQPLWQKTPTHLFIGDTLHVLATFRENPQGSVTLKADFGNCIQLQQTTEIVNIDTDDGISTLARFMASQQVKHLQNRNEKVALAIKYQLMCKETAYLVVDVNPDIMKSNGMPNLRKVPQMLAAGWGGVGQLSASEANTGYLDMPMFCRRVAAPESHIMFSITHNSKSEEIDGAKTTPKQFVLWCKVCFAWSWFTQKLSVKSLDRLLAAHMPDIVLNKLYGAIGHTNDDQAEQQVIIAFFHMLLESDVGQYFTAKQQQAITRAYQTIAINSDIEAYLAEVFEALIEEDWGISMEWTEHSDD
jgi:Ca-activated chloride channel family protein